VNLHRALILIACAAIGTSAAGCRGDPGIGFYASNGSKQAVIVQFTTEDGVSTMQGSAVPPKAYGNTLVALGPTSWHGRVRALDGSCRLLWDGRVDARSGGVVVAQDGKVSWSSADPAWPVEGDQRPAISETRKCNVVGA
jgi:hypothetical protein